MDYKEQKKEVSGLDTDKGHSRNDYKFLFQKLKSIKDIINTLEQKFLEKKD